MFRVMYSWCWYLSGSCHCRIRLLVNALLVDWGWETRVTDGMGGIGVGN